MAYQVFFNQYDRDGDEEKVVTVLADSFEVENFQADRNPMLRLYRDDHILMAAFYHWAYVIETVPDAQ